MGIGTRSLNRWWTVLVPGALAASLYPHLSEPKSLNEVAREENRKAIKNLSGTDFKIPKDKLLIKARTLLTNDYYDQDLVDYRKQIIKANKSIEFIIGSIDEINQTSFSKLDKYREMIESKFNNPTTIKRLNEEIYRVVRDLQVEKTKTPHLLAKKEQERTLGKLTDKDPDIAIKVKSKVRAFDLRQKAFRDSVASLLKCKPNELKDFEILNKKMLPIKWWQGDHLFKLKNGDKAMMLTYCLENPHCLKLKSRYMALYNISQNYILPFITPSQEVDFDEPYIKPKNIEEVNDIFKTAILNKLSGQRILTVSPIRNSKQINFILSDNKSHIMKPSHIAIWFRGQVYKVKINELDPELALATVSKELARATSEAKELEATGRYSKSIGPEMRLDQKPKSIFEFGRPFAAPFASSGYADSSTRIYYRPLDVKPFLKILNYPPKSFDDSYSGID